MKQAYLTTIPDETKMTPAIFRGLIQQFRHHHHVRYGLSKKHTADIAEYRKQINATDVTSSVYSIPVTYDTEVTYVSN